MPVFSKGQGKWVGISGPAHPTWKGYGKRNFVCVVCGSSFRRYVHPKRQMVPRFCSKNCQYLATGVLAAHWQGGGGWRNCLNCGAFFFVPLWEDKKYCNSICASQAESIDRRGERNPAWKGGIAPIITKWENNCYYEIQKRNALVRDNFRCRKCGKGGFLHVHHERHGTLENALQNGDDPHRLDNLKTLCPRDHRLVENEVILVENP